MSALPQRHSYFQARIHADGLADGDLLGLNKRGNLSLNLRGVGEATGVGVGLGDTSAGVLLRIRLGVGETGAGDSATEGDALLSTGGAASVVFCARCFGGEGDSLGVPVSSCDWTCATKIVSPIPNTSGRILLAITFACWGSGCRSRFPCC